MGNMLWVVENGTEMAENEWGAKPTLRPFYKDFARGRKFGPNGIEIGVQEFFWGALHRKPRAFAVDLGSLAMGNMLWVVENRKEMAKNAWDAKLTLRPFYKDFWRGRQFAPNGIETGVHKIFWEQSCGNQGLLQLVQDPCQWETCFELWKIGLKWPKTSETRSPPFGHFIKYLGLYVDSLKN